MKLCPTCHRCYEDSEDSCLQDHAKLVLSRPGTRLIENKYRLDRLLAQGGMGAVYAGHHITLDRPIALKLLLPALVIDQEALERFRREARAAARVDHPNLAEIYDFGSLPTGGAYLVMELVDGLTLREHMRNEGRLSAKEAVIIAWQVAEGVEAAHKAGIVHRDLKPSNIIVVPTGRGRDQWQIKIIDFGIAKFIEQTMVGECGLTATGSLVGTPRYMSPEQCTGELVDVRSDIYSLGIILYEMLAGQPPFDAPSGTAIAIKQTQEPPPPIHILRPELPDPLAQLIMQSLNKNPASRPQTAAEVAVRLLKIEQDLAPTTQERSLKMLNSRPRARPRQAPTSVSSGAAGYQAAFPARDLRKLSAEVKAQPPSHTTTMPMEYNRQMREVTEELTNNLVKESTPRDEPAQARPGNVASQTKTGKAQGQIIPQNRRRHPLLAALTFVVILGLGVGALWHFRPDVFYWMKEFVLTSSAALPSIASATRAEPIVNGNPEPAALEADRQALRAAFDGWIAATNAGDIDRQMAFYLPTLEAFYLIRNVRSEEVRAEKIRVFGKARLVTVRADEPVISLNQDGQTAIMRFQKRYVIRGRKGRQRKFMQELRWRETDDGWKISSERNLRLERQRRGR
ncbi:MAG: protein kinase [Acidobacteria bacterium]|nr:protein kinase [Acidobacteriota bacterium]